MSKYAIINLKTDPDLKALAAATAAKLGVSLSAVLNNELRRFAIEQSVVFELPEVPNPATAALLDQARVDVAAGDYHRSKTNQESIDFIAAELK